MSAQLKALSPFQCFVDRVDLVVDSLNLTLTGQAPGNLTLFLEAWVCEEKAEGWLSVCYGLWRRVRQRDRKIETAGQKNREAA